MSKHRSWLAQARRTLASHVDRLQETLVTLTDRLRETVAQAVSVSVGTAVRDAVQALFTDSDPARATSSYFERSPYRGPSYWGERDPYERDEYEEDLRSGDWREGQSSGWREVRTEATVSTSSEQRQERHQARWHQALAVGCHAAAWWLRREVGRFSTVTALVVGAVATAAAFVAGIALAESALNLLNLANSIRSGAQAMAVFRTS
jgi:hypothetical protein